MLHNTHHTSTVLRGPVRTVDQHLYNSSAYSLSGNQRSNSSNPQNQNPRNQCNPFNPRNPRLVRDYKHTPPAYPFPIPHCIFRIFCKKSTHITSIFYEIYQNNEIGSLTFGNDLSVIVSLLSSVTERENKRQVRRRKAQKTTGRKTQSTR